jgi:hypothetical protein
VILEGDDVSTERLKGRHGLHNLLTDTYGVEIPESDFQSIVVLLDRAELTQRAIADLLDRFTPHPWGDCYQRLLQVLAEDVRVPPEELDRVEQKLALHGYRELPDPLEEPSTFAVDVQSRLPEDDGPDGLHRLHAMLAGGYPIEIPPRDYAAVIILLGRLRVSMPGIFKLLCRFHPRGMLPTKEEVESILGGDPPVADEDVARVEATLTSHGLAELASVANPRWLRPKGEP